MNIKKYFILSSFFLLALGCSNIVIRNNKKTSADIFTINKQDYNKEIWSRFQVFNSEQEALNYALDRRITIQRFHQLKSEPYFGTPSQKKCEGNIDIKGEVTPIKNGSYFFLKVLANEYYSMGDCLKDNNTQEAYYEFFICKDGQLLELRHYQPYDLPPPKLQNYQCEQQ